MYGLFSLAPQPYCLRKLLGSDSSWADYFFDLFVCESMSWRALEKCLISGWNALRCNSAIQVSAICKCKTKQTLKNHCDMSAVVTEVSFYSIIPWALKVQFLTLNQNLLWMGNLWTSYVQPSLLYGSKRFKQLAEVVR